MKNMNNYFNNMLIIILFMTITMSYTTNNIYLMWMLMEISTMTFITLMIMNDNKISSVLYFFMSFMSSSIMLICFLTNSNSNLINFMLLMSLILKLNLMPFHNWFFYMIKSMNWFNMFLMMTLLKFIPMQILFLMFNNNKMLIYIIMINLILPPIMALNKNSMKLIIVYSSIYQTSTMMILMTINYNLFINYYIFYTLMTYLLTEFMNMNNNMNSLNSMLMSKNMKMMMFIMLLMYSFFPPMTSFLNKWLLLENLLKLNIYIMYMMLMIIMISSVIMIYNYMTFIMNNMYEYNFNKMFLKNKPMKNKLLNMIYCMFMFLMMMYVFYSI